MKKLIKFKGELQQMWKAGGTSFDHRAKLNIWLRVQLTGNMALCADQSAPNKTLKPTFFFTCSQRNDKNQPDYTGL